MEVLTFVLLLTAGIITYILIATLRSIFWPPKAVTLEYTPQQVGSITLEELLKCNGLDPTRPILFSVRGKIYDATESRDFYGPGGAYHVFAGREIARALGKMAIVEAECRGDIEDLTPRELSILNDWVDKFNQKYTVVGQVVAPKHLTLDQLMKYDGKDPSLPIYLAIRGVIFDVTKGKDYYGPDGVYPFAGRECARALAKMSTDIKDCTADVQDCSLAEMDALRDWEARFQSKYIIVGKVLE